MAFHFGRFCMSRFPKVHNHKPAFASALAAFGLVLGLNASHAQNATETAETLSAGLQHAATAETVQPSAPKAEPTLAKPYYIEFRSRSAQSYGHTFSIY